MPTVEDVLDDLTFQASEIIARQDQSHLVIDLYNIICQKCPNLLKGVCKTKELVQGYDHMVLSFCGLKENSQISWFEFSRLINEKIIIPDQRKSICGNCQWTEVCERKV